MLWCNGGGSARASRRIDGSTDGPEMDASRNQLRQLGGQYDIRPTNEDLYMAVLACRLAEDRRP